MHELLCSGIDKHVRCISIYGILLGDTAVKLPEQYKDWNIEKAIYSPENDKIYVEISRQNVKKVITL